MLESNINYSFVCCGYNCVNWVEQSLNSMLLQNYKNFKIICIDANSDDGTYEVLKKYQSQFSEKIILEKNSSRKYQVENTKHAVSMADPESVIITVDLDDWLPHSNVLNILNKVYSDPNIWMTYGTYCHYPYQDVSHLYYEYPENVKINGTFKQYGRWLASHLRTFRAKLFLSIPDDVLKNQNNEYFDMAGDGAFMYPMLEMARERSSYLNDILYVYNKTNALSEDKINVVKQETVAQQIKEKRVLERLDNI